MKKRTDGKDSRMGFFAKGISPKSIIVFDMDNTLVDEFGATVRHGMPELLHSLRADYRLFLWTNSVRQRAIAILGEHKLRSCFERCIFREDYDATDKGIRKDLRSIAGKFLIDDDPAEIEFNRKNGVACYLIPAYRKAHAGKADGEAARILKIIRG